MIRVMWSVAEDGRDGVVVVKSVAVVIQDVSVGKCWQY